MVDPVKTLLRPPKFLSLTAVNVKAEASCHKFAKSPQIQENLQMHGEIKIKFLEEMLRGSIGAQFALTYYKIPIAVQ